MMVNSLRRSQVSVLVRWLDEAGMWLTLLSVNSYLLHWRVGIVSCRYFSIERRALHSCLVMHGFLSLLLRLHIIAFVVHHVSLPVHM